MPLVKEDLIQIEKLFKELIAKESESHNSHKQESQGDLIEKTLYQMDKRFEQVDKRFAELREDTNRRFAELREDMNRRFEEQRKNTDKRFSQLFWFIGLFIPLNNSLLFLAISYIVK